jgi:AraC-like DNA-binding protein
MAGLTVEAHRNATARRALKATVKTVQTDSILVSRSLPVRLAALGQDVPRILRAAGLPGVLPAEGKFQLTTRQYFALWDAIAELSGDPAIGLRIGAESSAGPLDIASLSALHSANLGEALRKLARYKRLICPEDIRVEVRGREAAVTFRWLLAEGVAPNPLTDATFASALALARRGSGQALKPRRVELTRRTAQRSLLARHFGCELRFDAPMDVLVFDADSLDVPFITRNDDLLAVLLPELDAGLAAFSKTQSLADEVDAVLARSMQGQRPSVQALARELGMSSRTLQRRLTQDGTSYQQQLDHVRRRIARQLLDRTDLALGEIAFFLGFEEINSFWRAFNQWEGKSPNQWRRAA